MESYSENSDGNGVEYNKQHHALSDSASGLDFYGRKNGFENDNRNVYSRCRRDNCQYKGEKLIFKPVLFKLFFYIDPGKDAKTLFNICFNYLGKIQ